MALKIVGLCVHGLLGNLYSLGMDSLATKLNAATPEGVHFDVVGGDNPDLEAGALTRRLLDVAGTGAVPMVIGHSLGGNFVWRFADSANAAGVKLPLLASIDPVQWTDNDPKPPIGKWVVPGNVAIAFNFRQPFYPGGGFVTARDTNATLVQEHTYSYPHANVGQQLAMDTAPDIQAVIVTAVLDFVRRASVA
jgi:pimeloyl-ACP methyl ester carboxylesterase